MDVEVKALKGDRVLSDVLQPRESDVGGGDGRKVRADLVETDGRGHSLLSTLHQHLLELSAGA